MRATVFIATTAVFVALASAQYAPGAVSAIYPSNSRDCHQLACWIGSSSESCAKSVADRVQEEITKGRDAYWVEEVNLRGIWVRYWRTKVEPVDRGVVVKGVCADNTTYVVENCQSGSKKVKC